MVQYYTAWVEENDHSEHHGCLCIAMEHCERGDLHQYIRQQKEPLDNATVMTVAVQMLSAIAHMHHHKLLHRDLKPSNLFIARRPGKPDTLLVGDFGLITQPRAHRGAGPHASGHPSVLFP